MAVGEYVSASTQRDTERAMLYMERRELELQPDAELDELAGLYEARGLSPQTARGAKKAIKRTAKAARPPAKGGTKKRAKSGAKKGRAKKR